MNAEKEKNIMTIDEEKIREAAERAAEKMRENPVWKLLDAVEGEPHR